MTPFDEAAQAATVTARAAAGMCDADDMQRTMGQASADIAQSAEAMQALYEVHVPGYTDGHWWLTDSEAYKFRADGCTVRMCHCGEMDFSLCNDAALAGIADQGDDWLDWRWTIGDLGL